MDSIADAITRIRNAASAGKERVNLPSSRLMGEVVRVLKEEGYIANFRVAQDARSHSWIRVQLKKHDKNKPVIHNLARASKSSRRIYRGYKEMPRVLQGLGMAIVSTSKGIMTDRKARQLKVGGEVLCRVY
jgi:small subunit ribosomal protein S8